MEKLLTELIRRYGPRIVVLLIAVAGLVWGIAHFIAKPGERVSVFGIEYTKGESQPELEASWPRSPNGRYEAVKVRSERGWQLKVIEVETRREILITQGEFDTPNDVKAGLFSPDSKRFAAAYEYTASEGRNHDYTWVGIWNLETGRRVDVQTIDGWNKNIYSVFKKGVVPDGK